MPDNVNYSEFYVNAHAFSEYVVAATAPYNWEYPPERLRVECMIGKGAFCQVAKGYSEDLGAVAVKMLKGKDVSQNVLSQRKPFNLTLNVYITSVRID